MKTRLIAYPLFVYGTLKRKRVGKHALLRDARFVDLAYMSGNMYDLGNYPRVVPDARRVFGELYEIPDEAADRALRALPLHARWSEA